MTQVATNRVTFSPIANGDMKQDVETGLQLVSDDQIDEIESDPEMGLFRIINQKDGDKRLVWDRTKMADISEARKLFGQLLSQGLQAHRVGGDGAAMTKVIDEFDPVAEEIIFMPVKMIAAG